MPFIAHRFRKLINDLDSIYEAVNFVFSFNYLGFSIRPDQVKEEIVSLLKLVERLKPRVILEIGTAAGGTLFLFCRASDPKVTIISIDLPGGRFGGGYPKWKIPLYKSFAKDLQRIYLIRANSHDSKTLEKVKNFLRGRRIDFLFIDGDHSYEGVRRDFEMYSLLVRSGGMVALHDIVVHPPQTGCEVSKFWNEIKSGYKYVEIVKDWNQKWAGIGVLYV
ncbi:MAG: class I SAM-dependent methyltransferase [Candidatus Jordarchaeaceae archaeon]